MADVTRDVVLNLKLISDPGNSAVARAVASEAAKARSGSVGGTSALKVEQEKFKTSTESLKVESALNAAVAAEAKARAAALATEQQQVKLDRERLRLAGDQAKLQLAPKIEGAKREKAIDDLAAKETAAHVKAEESRAAAAEASDNRIAINRQKLLAKLQLETTSQAAKREKAIDDLAAKETAAHVKAEEARVAAAEASGQRIAINRQKLLGKIAAAENNAMAAKAREEQRSVLQLAALENRNFAIRQAGLQSLSRAGHGALMAAKGALQAGAFTDTEKDSEKLLKTVLQLEVGFQALRGGLDVILGLRQGFEMWRRAVIATEVANKLLAASNIQVAVTGAAASAVGVGGVAGVAGKAIGLAGVAGRAAGVAGIAGNVAGVAGAAGTASGVAGLGVALKAGSAALGTFALKFIAAPLALFEVTQSLHRVAKGQDVFSRDVEGASEGMIHALLGWREAVQGAEASTEKLTKAEEDLARQKKVRADREARIERMGTFALEAQNREAALRASVVGVTVGNELEPQARAIKQADQLHLMALQEAEQMEARRDAAIQRRLAVAGSPIGREALLAELAAEKQLESAVERVADSEMKKIEALREQVTLSKQTIENSKAQARASADALKAEQETYTSRLAAFGALTSGEQEYIRQIVRRIKTGQAASDFELDYLNKRGLALELGEQRRAEAGIRARGEEVLEFTGGRDKLTIAQKREAEDRIKISENERKAKEAQARLMAETQIAGLPFQRLGVTRARQAALGETLAGEAGLTEAQQATAVRRGAGAPIQKLSDDAAAVIQEETELQIRSFNGLIDGLLKAQADLRGEFDRRQVEIAGNR